VASTATRTPPQERILPGETAYDVRAGDTLSSIAARVHVNSEALALVNADVLPASGALVPGMRLAIPAIYQPGVAASRQPRPLYYTLRHGDTLYDVGQRFGIDWHAIARYNHITDQYSLSVGQGIIIPAQP
jgi:LysM repeat protein